MGPTLLHPNEQGAEIMWMKPIDPQHRKGSQILGYCSQSAGSFFLAILIATIANSVGASTPVLWHIPPLFRGGRIPGSPNSTEQVVLIALACIGLVGNAVIFEKQWKLAWIVANLALFAPTIAAGYVYTRMFCDAFTVAVFVELIIGLGKAMLVPVLLPLGIVWLLLALLGRFPRGKDRCERGAEE